MKTKTVVPDLHALRLDSNKLVDFGQSFVNLRFLLMLNISNNRISSFDYAQIPLGLQWLDLHSNKIDKLNNFYYSPTAQQQFIMNNANDNNSNNPSSIGQQWSSLLRLTTLDASYNLIREIDNTSLPESLETVQLNNNQLRTISSHTFSSKSNLTRINLSSNLLTTMPSEALKLTATSQHLQNRDMAHQTATQHNKFVDIYLANNPFLCNCQMGWLSQLLLASATLNPSPIGLNLSQGLTNNLSNSNNVISSGSNPSSNQMLLLREHQLILARQLPRVADAHLVSCHLSFARQAGPYYALASQAVPTPTSDHHFTQQQQQQQSLWYPVMAANQLAIQNGQLNLHSQHLQQNYRNSYHSSGNPRGSSSSVAAVATPSTDSLVLRQSELLASVHLCSYKSHCFALCNCCDFDACDCEMTCPENCSCYYAHAWSTNIVDCSANNQLNNAANSQYNINNYQHQQRGLTHNYHASSGNSRMIFGQQQQLVKFTKIPDRIPMDVTDLYLDGLQLYSVKANALIGRNKLKSLYLNDSQIHSIERKAFAHQKSLRILQLNSNQIEQLHGFEFEEQHELRELYLANNRLTHIANGTFAMLKSLQVLHLQNNLIYHFDFWSNFQPTASKANYNKLMSIHLGHNPWSCQCEFIEPMLNWLHVNVQHLADRKSITCQFNATTSLQLLTTTTNQLSGSSSLISSGSGVSSMNTGAINNPVDELLDNMMMISSSSLSGTANSNNANAYDPMQSAIETNAMFDVNRCLNHTVYPQATMLIGPNNVKYLQQQQPAIQMPNGYEQPGELAGPSTSNTPSATSGSNNNIVPNNNNNNFAPQPPNDDPFPFISTDRSQQQPQQITSPPSAFHQQTSYPDGDLANWNGQSNNNGGGALQNSAHKNGPGSAQERRVLDYNNVANGIANGYSNNFSTYQLPPTSDKSRALLLTGSPASLLITFIMVLLIAIIVISLIHYRRPVGQWIYSHSRLQMLPGAKSAHHHHNHHHHAAHHLSHPSLLHSHHGTLHHDHSLVLSKQHHQHHQNSTFGHQQQHLHQQSTLHNQQHLQYGISSAGSTSSSSAASTNMSQALCHQQQQQHSVAINRSNSSTSSPPSSSGANLVTTPLIVTNSNHHILSHLHSTQQQQQHHHLQTQHLLASKTTTTATPNNYSNCTSIKNDEEKLFDAYLTYSKFDEQLVNECIAPELECGQSAYR